MADLGLMMGLGAGMQTAGALIDKNWQMQMEQRRQQSLAELEARRLDIMDKANQSEAEYRKGMLKATTGEAFDKAKESFYNRMDTIAEQIVSKLPDEAAARQAQELLKSVMRDDDLMASFYDTSGSIDTEKLGEYINELSKVMPSSALQTEEAQSAIKRFATSMSKEWKSIKERFPEYATEMTPADIIDQLPAFYRLSPTPGSQGTDDPLMGSAGDGDGGVTEPPPAPPMTAAPPPGIAQRTADAGGLMSKEGAGQLYRDVSDAMFRPWIEDFELRRSLPGALMDANDWVMDKYMKAENAASRFLFGDQFMGMTRGADGQLRFPDAGTPNIDPSLRDDYSLR